MTFTHNTPTFASQKSSTGRVMDYRTSGLEGLRVSAVGLGCMGMSHAYGAPAGRQTASECFRPRWP